MDTLQRALDCGIIDLGEVQFKLKMLKTEEMLAHHPYKITKLKNGRWQTYFKRPSGKLLTMRAPSREKLIDKLYDLYFEHEIKRLLFRHLFTEWLEYKRKITSSPNTIKRHVQHYNRYIKDTWLDIQSVNEVKALELNAYCNEMVKEHDMPRPEWVNVKTIIKGVFEYAVDMDFIEVSPISRVKITVKFRQSGKKTDGSKIFNKEEEQKFKDYLLDRFDDTKDLSFMAVLINMTLGLRVGELVALKWADLFDDHVRICREEIRDQELNEYFVAPHTKGYRERDVTLIPDARRAFKLIRHMYPFAKDDDFIFVRDGKRLCSRQIVYVYEKYAKTAHVQVKRSHTTRRTYASKLNAGGVPVDEIRKQLGHSDLATTMRYLYNPLTDKDTFDKISEALT